MAAHRQDSHDEILAVELGNLDDRRGKQYQEMPMHDGFLHSASPTLESPRKDSISSFATIVKPTLTPPSQPAVQDVLAKAAVVATNTDPKAYSPTRVKIPPPEGHEGVLGDPRFLNDDYARETTPHQLRRLADSLFRSHANHLKSIEGQLAFTTDTLIYEKKREAEKLIEAAEKAHESNFWDFLKKIAGAILGVVSIIVGSTLIALGGPIGWAAGSLLIVSGATSITATVLAQVGVNPEVTSIIGLVAAGIGLVGSVASLFTIAHSLPHLIATIANASFTVGSGITTIGSEEMKRQLSEIDEEMTYIRREISLDDVTMKQLSMQADLVSEDLISTTERCHSIVAKHEQTKRRMTAMQVAHIAG